MDVHSLMKATEQYIVIEVVVFSRISKSLHLLIMHDFSFSDTGILGNNL